jgi:hypothetical protein
MHHPEASQHCWQKRALNLRYWQRIAPFIPESFVFFESEVYI